MEPLGKCNTVDYTLKRVIKNTLAFNYLLITRPFLSDHYQNLIILRYSYYAPINQIWSEYMERFSSYGADKLTMTFGHLTSMIGGNVTAAY